MPFRKGNFVIMKVDLETSNSYTEVMTVINTLPTIDRTKIPDKLLNIIKENSNPDYNFQVDILVSMNAWKLSETAKLILATIFRDYLATETQSQKIKLAEQQQIQKLEDMARQKYNPDDIFKKRNIIQEEKKEEVALVEIKKENKLTAFFRKILYLIFNKVD